jgi:hypothetical protein
MKCHFCKNNLTVNNECVSYCGIKIRYLFRCNGTIMDHISYDIKDFKFSFDRRMFDNKIMLSVSSLKMMANGMRGGALFTYEFSSWNDIWDPKQAEVKLPFILTFN